MTRKDLFLISIVRPTKLLFSPICTFLCVYTAVTYDILFLLFTTFTFVFQGQYNFSSGQVGLSYIGIGAGMFVGLFIMAWASDRHIKLKQACGLEVTPEDRVLLYQAVPGAMCMPVRLLIYGSTAFYNVHWIVR